MSYWTMRRLVWLVLAAGCCVLGATATATPSATAAEQGQVEASLLSLFGMTRRPRSVGPVYVPPALLELYQRHARRPHSAAVARPGINARNANTVRTHTHTETRVDRRFPGHHKFRLFFNISSIPKFEKLKAAEVQLSRESIKWLTTSEGSKEHLQHVLVHDIVRPGIRGKQDPLLRLIDSKTADTRQNNTFSLDVMPAVERWTEYPKQNHGLLIQVIGFGEHKGKPLKHLRLRRSADESPSQWVTKQPLLFTYTDDGKNKEPSESIVQRRARRASANKHKNKRKDGKELCKRHKLYVDFTEVGWNDWIVAPPGYEAYYCSGDCPFPLSDHLNSTNHAVVQTLMNSVYPQSVPKACCVPTSLNSMSMLYLHDDHKVVLKNYQDMSVLGCGCR